MLYPSRGSVRFISYIFCYISNYLVTFRLFPCSGTFHAHDPRQVSLMKMQKIKRSCPNGFYLLGDSCYSTSKPYKGQTYRLNFYAASYMCHREGLDKWKQTSVWPISINSEAEMLYARYFARELGKPITNGGEYVCKETTMCHATSDYWATGQRPFDVLPTNNFLDTTIGNAMDFRFRIWPLEGETLNPSLSPYMASMKNSSLRFMGIYNNKLTAFPGVSNDYQMGSIMCETRPEATCTQVCPDETWALVGNQCIHLSIMERYGDWYEALDICASMGGYLAHIDDMDEYNLYASVLEGAAEEKFWIAATTKRIRCPDGFSYYPTVHKCYKLVLFENAYKVPELARQCVHEGGYLPIIQKVDEFVFFSQQKFLYEHWIGLSSKYNKRVEMDNDEAADYAEWMNGLKYSPIILQGNWSVGGGSKPSEVSWPTDVYINTVYNKVMAKTGSGQLVMCEAPFSVEKDNQKWMDEISKCKVSFVDMPISLSHILFQMLSVLPAISLSMADVSKLCPEMLATNPRETGKTSVALLGLQM